MWYAITLFVGFVVGYAIGLSSKERQIEEEIKLRKQYEEIVWGSKSIKKGGRDE